MLRIAFAAFNGIQRKYFAYLGHMPVDALKIFDTNLRQSFYIKGLIGESLKIANVLKLGEEELPVKLISRV